MEGSGRKVSFLSSRHKFVQFQTILMLCSLLTAYWIHVLLFFLKVNRLTHLHFFLKLLTKYSLWSLNDVWIAVFSVSRPLFLFQYDMIHDTMQYDMT